MTPSRQPSRLYFKLVLTAVFWGGTFIAGRIIAREMGPFLASFLRFAVATACLMVFLKLCGSTLPRLSRRMVMPVLALGLTGVFAYNALFFSGLKTVPASRASLIIASNPAFIAIFAFLLFREPLNLRKAFGILLSITGAVVVIARGNPTQLLHGSMGLGEIYILGCVMSWVAYSLIGKVVMRELSPLVSVTLACGIGALFLVLPASFEVLAGGFASYSLRAWVSIFYLGIFGSAIGFIWYYEGIQALGPSRAGVFINIVPISAVILAYLFLDETIEWSLVLGCVLVVSGVLLTNRSG